MKNIFASIHEYFECKKLRKELIEQKKGLIKQKERETESELELLRMAYNKVLGIRYDHQKAKIIERTYKQGPDSYEALHELESYKKTGNSGVCEDIAFAFLKETMKINLKHFHVESRVGYTDRNMPHAWTEVLNLDSHKKYKVDPTWKIFMEPL